MLIHRIAAQLYTAEALQTVEAGLDSGEDVTLAVSQSGRTLMAAAQFARRPRPTVYIVSGEDAADRAARSLAAYVGLAHVCRFPERKDYPWREQAPDDAVVGFLLNGFPEKLILFFYILFFSRCHDLKFRIIFFCCHLTSRYQFCPEIIGIIFDLRNIYHGTFLCLGSFRRQQTGKYHQQGSHKNSNDDNFFFMTFHGIPPAFLELQQTLWFPFLFRCDK